MTNEEYHADTTHISKSGLDQIAKSPAHYYAKYLAPDRVKEEPTPALLFGTALHMAILEPDEFNKKYFILDDTAKCLEIGGSKPRSTTKYKDWKTEQELLFAGRTELHIDDYTKCIRMQEAARKHPTAKVLLEKGIAEQSIFWTDQETGAPCKMRKDWYSQNTGHIVDLKSTEDASPEGFARSVWKYRYHVQGPLYMDGFLAHYKQAAEHFSFIAIEKEPPYAVGVYYVPEEVYKLGRKIYKDNLRTYMEALKKGVWDAYSDDFLPLQLPGFAYKHLNQNDEL